jgi:hypothetical protein
MDEKLRERGAGGTVRITLPAQITYDPNALKESIAKMAEMIGHPDCFSGAACLFRQDRDFLYDREVKANSAGAAGVPRTEAVAMVALAPAVKYDIGNVMLAVDKVIDLIGPHPCISGFDVLFRDQMLVINEQLEGQRFG